MFATGCIGFAVRVITVGTMPPRELGCGRGRSCAAAPACPRLTAGKEEQAHGAPGEIETQRDCLTEQTNRETDSTLVVRFLKKEDCLPVWR